MSKITSGTKEWMPNNLNCFVGCDRDCTYCYAKLNAVRYGQKTKETWHIMKPMKKQTVSLYDSNVMFPSTHDLPSSQINIWMPFLHEILRKGNNVLIVSKPEIKSILAICNYLYEYSDKMEFRFTIGTEDDNTRKILEPNASNIEERIACLENAYAKGFETSVSMEPLLTRIPAKLIERIDPFITRTIWIGTMNHMHYTDFPNPYYYYEQIWINGEQNMSKVHEQLKNNPKIRYKDTVQKLLGITQDGKKL